jgi:NAD(P)-dependent dehydrogenase (short-subunit alcohol dehydrogenase family)
MRNNIEGKIVVISGASSGLGEATARLLSTRARSSCSARGGRIASRLWRGDRLGCHWRDPRLPQLDRGQHSKIQRLDDRFGSSRDSPTA